MDTQDWNAVDQSIENIKKFQDSHNDLVMRLAKANPSFSLVDLYVWAITQRSILLINGFSQLVDARNFLAATPLARLQLDNCMRLHALYIVDDPHELIRNVMNDVHIRNQKDTSGEKMTDAYLVSRLDAIFPGLKEFYNDTSGYVHLSDTHLSHIMRSKDPSTGKFEMSFGSLDVFVPAEDFCTLATSFHDITHILVSMINGVVKGKEEAAW